MTQNRKRQLREAMARFNQLDADGSGALSLDELRALIPGDERQVTLLLAKFDDNGDGELQMKEFIQLNKFLWIQADRRVARDVASAACDELGCSGLVDDHAARLFAAACDGDAERCATAQRVLREWLRDAAPAAITRRLVGDCVRVATLNAFIAHLDDELRLRQMPSPASRFVAAFAAQRMDAMLSVMPQRLTPEWKREVEEAWRIARVHLLDAQRDASGAERIALPPAAAAAFGGAEGALLTPVRR